MRNYTEFVEAIKTGEEKIRRIYICSPLSANTQSGIAYNMLCAKDKMNVLNGLLKPYGIKAWAAHGVLPKILDDTIEEERQLGIDFGNRLLEMSDVIYIFGSHLSTGMKAEIKYAVESGIDVIFDNDMSDEVQNDIKEYIYSIVGGERKCQK